MLIEVFQRVDVSSWDVITTETSGDEPKYWLQAPGADLRWLLKTTTIKEGQDYGEDWVEKAVAHLGRLLGVPCARVELAEMHGQRGCISADLCPRSYSLQHGQVLLEEHGAPGYVHGKGRDHPGHTLENIRASLDGAQPPPGCELPFDGTAYDVFAGYVVMDAWVANRDRHDNNWAVLLPSLASGGPPCLSGSYDHASSLGFNLTDEKRTQLVTQNRVASWCERGTAWRFDYARGTTLVELAARALRLASPAARNYWLAQLCQVQQSEVRDVLARVPRLSDPARIFAEMVLDVNRRRILDGCV